MTDKLPLGDYNTRDGLNAKVLAYVPEPNASKMVLLGAVEWKRAWTHQTWTSDGRFFGPEKKSCADLMPHEVHEWRNVYLNAGIMTDWYPSRQACDDQSALSRIGRLHRITRGNEVTYKFESIKEKPDDT